jgi:WhiB family redox-sensing transcriptional regulator
MSAALYETLIKLPDLPGAACRNHDPELWTADEVDFGKAKWTSRVREAKAICGTCPARAACLQYALSARLGSGIWGGLTGDERKEESRSPLIGAGAKRCARGGHPLQPGSDICITCDDAAAKRRERDRKYREKVRKAKQIPRKPRGGRCSQCKITKHRCAHPVDGAA